MVEENFVLKWKSHTDQLRKSLHQMMMSESVTVKYLRDLVLREI